MELKRDVDAALLAALQGPFFPIAALDLDWPGTAIRAHSGVGDITWNGLTFAGVGPFAQVALPAEEGGLVPPEATITIVGELPDIFADAEVGATARGIEASFYFGAVTSRGSSTLIGNLQNVYTGHLDAQKVVVADENEADMGHGLQLTFKTGPGARSVADVVHSHEDQTVLYPGDTLFRFVIRAIAKLRVTSWPEN